MSLPLTRRIAQAALLVAATAAPLAAAGAASATEVVPQTDLGAGVTKLADVPNSGDTVQGATHELGQMVGTTGSAALAAGGPAVGDAAGHTAAQTLPSTEQLTSHLPAANPGQLTGALGTLSDRVVPAVEQKVGPAVTDKVIPAARKATATPLQTVAKGLPVDRLAQSLPAAQKLAPVLEAAQSLPLTSTVTGLAEHESANRLGGTPSLGGGSSPLGSLLAGTPLGGLLGGGLPVG